MNKPSTATLVTGNTGKLAEWRRLFPEDIPLESADIDLEEIQSLDLEAIAIDKAKRAYEQIGSPVLVEDIAAGLNKLHGLPGPFIKFFELQLGADALFQLAGREGEAAVVSCVIAYYDGEQAVAVRADVTGIVTSKRGSHGFGFDVCFVPDGQDKTYGQMTPAEKDTISHRAKAIKLLLAHLKAS